ncbi:MULTISPECIES: hypothetical protein [unclassified Leisingera]|uniref:hypothetical protein n=1 Tax=unclassified Leisingera TaxID=2614906 RepID=UPI0021A815B2|nr:MULTISPECIES: hypothetical protein [unclassified Leisingera]UWQ28127.1 hypothetical protein K3557_15290 [Leisingera sp. M523]UWQ75397.1 hypothetical protein K3724_02700 [Leisingera sp. M658]
MDKLTTYSVLSRIRRSGDVYEPDGERTEVELSEKEAAPLKLLGRIGEPRGQIPRLC